VEIVPLVATPAQTVAATLGGQAARVNVYQKLTGLFCDVLVNEAIVIAGVICHDRCLIVRSAYLGFIGDFTFIDNQGLTDPSYLGLGPGGRYSLAYLSAAEAAEVGVLP